MKYVQGPYIGQDVRRLKKIRSLEQDIQNHYAVFRGKVKEIDSPYAVPLVKAHLYEVEVDGNTVYFFKDYWGVTNPFHTSRNGLRIIFAIFMDSTKRVPIQYTPFIVFLAKEEKKRYLAPNGKRYPLTKANFKRIIEVKLERL